MLPYAIPMCSVAPTYDFGFICFDSHSPTRVLATISPIVSLNGSLRFRNLSNMSKNYC